VIDGVPVRRVVTSDWLDDRGEALRVQTEESGGLKVSRVVIGLA
jgi:hypothetical protein